MRTLLLSLVLCTTLGLPAHANETAAPAAAPEQARQMPDNIKQQLEAAGLMTQGMVANMDGKEAEAAGFYRQAIVIYDGLITAEPEHLDALNSRALAKVEIKDPSATADAEKVIEITTTRLATKPDDAKLYHTPLGPEAEAAMEETFNQLAEVPDGSPELHIEARIIKANLGRPAKAPVKAHTQAPAKKA